MFVVNFRIMFAPLILCMLFLYEEQNIAQKHAGRPVAHHTQTDEPAASIVPPPLSAAPATTALKSKLPAGNADATKDKPLPWPLHPEWMMVWVTLLYTFVTSRQLAAMKRQVREAKEAADTSAVTTADTLTALKRQADAMDKQTVILASSVEAAQKAADAAKASADIATGTSLPKLMIQEFKSIGSSSSSVREFFRFPRLDITIKNHGQSPAFVSAWLLCFHCGDIPLEPEYNLKLGVSLQKTVVEPGHTYTLPRLYPRNQQEFTDEDVTAIIARQKAFWAYGFITYKDMFGNPLMRFKFCERVLNIYDYAGSVMICDWWEGLAPPSYSGTDLYPSRSPQK